MAIFAIVAALFSLVVTLVIVDKMYDHDIALKRLDRNVDNIYVIDRALDKRVENIELKNEALELNVCSAISDLKERSEFLEFIIKHSGYTSKVDFVESKEYGIYYLYCTYARDQKLYTCLWKYNDHNYGFKPTCDIEVKKDTYREAVIRISGYKNLWLKLDKINNSIYEIPTPDKSVYEILKGGE